MTAPTCATCRFHDSTHKECRKHAPTRTEQVWPSDGTPSYYEARWIRVANTQWCGEHAPKGEGA